MELREQAAPLTMAQKLGDVTHVSPLLRKVRQVSGCSEAQIAQWLLKCAVERGARHYERDFTPGLPPDSPALTDTELGVALCLGHLPWDPAKIRAAAQLLSAEDIDPPPLGQLAVQERVEPVLLCIADAAARVGPELEPWAWLRTHLPRRHKVRTDSLPHWSRFVNQTGVTAFGGGPRIDWLRRATAK
jgi:hypothetical protein